MGAYDVTADVTVPTPECWKTWTISTSDKMEAMEFDFFIATSEALVFIDDEFENIVAHPLPDVLGSAAFKKKVITKLKAHGFIFATPALCLNPSNPSAPLLRRSAPSARDTSEG